MGANKMAIRIYIAGPYSKEADKEQARKRFYLESAKLRSQGYEVVNPMALPHRHNGAWESFMKEDIAAMMTCHRVHVLKGWENSDGANIEVDLAQKLKFWITYEK